ncbi:carbon-nitrogen hydrolase family protein [Nocardioides sp. TRM66260-LWL]|uniref:carbon-nitrogen hydrolase family protein n=1 Tax=Nocardioides sp. TRM66260-LWL TaxID=2874478 RepID=UPI001CC3A07A|nr:carbon-nitrogen hydrolase family protein [Nocardioides sp. TRM66260-LWL]MBZ5735437.1 carbon-nitrogen hydrolase family protein [Nocardioides sp. TRM66260-LWL]
MPVPSRPLEVALVQAASALDPEVNRARLPSLVPDGVDLAVLPEASARDFGAPGSDVAPFAEPLDGPYATALAAVAAARHTTVVAGAFETSADPDRPHNTLLVRGAVRAEYRKIHLYDSFGHRESDRLLAGPTTPVVVDLPVGDTAGDIWRLGLMTCYDLRFPELARALVDAGADVLVVPAAWVAGERKLDHWRTLVRARAIENTVHVLAAAQPAPRYTGHSLAVGPLGDVLAEAGPDEEVLRVALAPDAVAEARRANPSLANRRL